MIKLKDIAKKLLAEMIKIEKKYPHLFSGYQEVDRLSGEEAYQLGRHDVCRELTKMLSKGWEDDKIVSDFLDSMEYYAGIDLHDMEKRLLDDIITYMGKKGLRLSSDEVKRLRHLAWEKLKKAEMESKY